MTNFILHKPKKTFAKMLKEACIGEQYKQGTLRRSKVPGTLPELGSIARPGNYARCSLQKDQALLTGQYMIESASWDFEFRYGSILRVLIHAQLATMVP